MCVAVSVWLSWRGIRVAGWSLQHGYHSNPTTPKHQRTSNQEHTTNVVIQQNSRKLLMMDILMSETFWAHKKWNKSSKWHQVGPLFSTKTCTYINRGILNVSNLTNLQQYGLHFFALDILKFLICSLQRTAFSSFLWLLYSYQYICNHIICNH